MKDLKDAVDIVLSCLSDRLAFTKSPSQATDKNEIDLILSYEKQDLKYVCKVEEGEPKAIAIGRRLLSGRLNLESLQAGDIDSKLLDALMAIQSIAQNGDFQSLSSKSEINKAVWETFGKTAEVFLLDRRNAMINRIRQCFWGSAREIKSLDRLGYYEKSGTVEILDHFGHRDNINAAVKTLCREGKPNGDASFLKTEKSSICDVVKIDGVAFAINPGKVNGFVGNYAPKILSPQLMFSDPGFR
jgi:hypothetical protein